jgi:FMN phosphatase YigB (HAD superfamily)
MTSKKLIFFDLDDTLIHFEDYWKLSLKETFRRYEFLKDLNPEKLQRSLSY